MSAPNASHASILTMDKAPFMKAINNVAAGKIGDHYGGYLMADTNLDRVPSLRGNSLQCHDNFKLFSERNTN